MNLCKDIVERHFTPFSERKECDIVTDKIEKEINDTGIVVTIRSQKLEDRIEVCFSFRIPFASQFTPEKMIGYPDYLSELNMEEINEIKESIQRVIRQKTGSKVTIKLKYDSSDSIPGEISFYTRGIDVYYNDDDTINSVWIQAQP